MRKADLVKALEKQLAASKQAAPSKPEVKPRPVRVAHPVQAAAARDTSVSNAEQQVERSKYDVGVPTSDLSAKVPRDLPAGYGKDRIVVMVRDPYWLHCYWELTRQAILRAEAALGQDWHTAKPILRVLDVSSRGPNSSGEKAIRDIDIHGGCNNWYIDVNSPPCSFRVDIGYLAPAAVSMSWPAPTSSVRRAPASATLSIKIGRTSTPRRPTASSPCRAASTRPAQAAV